MLDAADNHILPKKAGKQEMLDVWDGKGAWRRYPRIYNTGAPPLLMRLRPEKGIGIWLRGEHRNKPKWRPKPDNYWEVPLAWQGDVIRRAVERYGAAIAIKPSASEVEKCASACWDAISDVTDCTCSCGGANHGIKGNPGGYYEINESLAVKWENDSYFVLTLFTPGRLDRAE